MSNGDEMKILQSGYTTGACSAAGVKAALILMKKNIFVDSVEVIALDGTILKIPIERIKKISADEVEVEVKKFSGDDPDITNGESIITTTKKNFADEIIFKAGIGVGKVTKSGLSIPIGEPAINFGPRQLIRNVINEFNFSNGFEITISVPNGIELSKKTLNPILGIEGGISIIGTTGVLKPMSEEAFKNSLAVQIDVAISNGFNDLIFTPGKIGENVAEKFFDKQSIIQTSNFIGFMLDYAVDKKINSVILFGHIGKLAKVAGGTFHTHNRIGDGRLETIAAYCAAENLNSSQVKKILQSNTTEDAINIIHENNFDFVFNIIAERATFRAKRYTFNKSMIGTILIDSCKNILGSDEFGRRFINVKSD